RGENLRDGRRRIRRRGVTLLELAELDGGPCVGLVAIAVAERLAVEQAPAEAALGVQHPAAHLVDADLRAGAVAIRLAPQRAAAHQSLPARSSRSASAVNRAA